MRLWIQRMMTRLHLAGLLHSEIHGYNAHLQLPVAYRS